MPDLPDDAERYLQHLAVERHLAARTLVLYRAALSHLHAAATADGVRSRPVFDIAPNGRRIIGAQPLRVFQQLLDAASSS